MLMLLTVPHSGTRFVAKVLDEWGVEHHRHHCSVGTYCDEMHFTQAIVTLRDPILVRMSQMNRTGSTRENTSYPVWLWRQVVRLARLPNVHCVRIDQPRDDEARRLAEFVGRPDCAIEWIPHESHPDTLGIKATYERTREVPDYLKQDADLLNRMGVGRMMQTHGCDYSWITDSERN